MYDRTGKDRAVAERFLALVERFKHRLGNHGQASYAPRRLRRTHCAVPSPVRPLMRLSLRPLATDRGG